MSVLRVVVVGASFASLKFLQTFLQKLKLKSSSPEQSVVITLIAPRRFAYNPIAAPRLICDYQKWKGRVFVPLDESLLFQKSTRPSAVSCEFIQGNVTGIQEGANKITVDLVKEQQQQQQNDGDQIVEQRVVEFDYLILGTGSNYASPCKINAQHVRIEDAMKEMETISEQLRAAKSVLVVGGGPVGCELAAEVAYHFPEKKVTLLHSGARLLDAQTGIHEKTSSAMLKALQGLKVEVVLGERADIGKDLKPTVALTVKTDKGREITSDHQFIATGIALNVGYLKSYKNGSMLNERHQIKVNDCLQVQDHPNIFALGDNTSAPGLKVAYLAAQQGEHLGKSLASALNTTTDPKSIKLKKYTAPGFVAMFLAMGPEKGVGQMGSWVVGDFLSKRLKSRDLFYPMLWDLTNQKVPK